MRQRECHGSDLWVVDLGVAHTTHGKDTVAYGRNPEDKGGMLAVVPAGAGASAMNNSVTVHMGAAAVFVSTVADIEVDRHVV